MRIKQIYVIFNLTVSQYGCLFCDAAFLFFQKINRNL